MPKSVLEQVLHDLAHPLGVGDDDAALRVRRELDTLRGVTRPERRHRLVDEFCDRHRATVELEPAFFGVGDVVEVVRDPLESRSLLDQQVMALVIPGDEPVADGLQLGGQSGQRVRSS